MQCIFFALFNYMKEISMRSKFNTIDSLFVHLIAILVPQLCFCAKPHLRYFFIVVNIICSLVVITANKATMPCAVLQSINLG